MEIWFIVMFLCLEGGSDDGGIDELSFEARAGKKWVTNAAKELCT